MNVLRNWRRRLVTGALIVLATGHGSATTAEIGTPRPNPITQGQGVAIDQRLGAQIPLDVTLRNERGQSVPLADLLTGKPVVLNLVYFECPMLCNLAMDGLIRSLRTLPYGVGDELTVITVSFDPREGPALAAAAKGTAVKRYGRPQAAEHWHFLTGDQQQIERLCKSVGFRYHWDAERRQYAHAAGIMVLTPEGVVSRYLLGVEYAPRDLRLSLVEAADKRIGSVTDQVLLLCYQYDPATGKYGLLIQRVLRGAGIVTLSLLASSIGLMLWSERRRTRRERSSAAGMPGGKNASMV